MPLSTSQILPLLEATSRVTGEAYFRTLVTELAEFLGVHAGFVSECVGSPPTHVRTLAYRVGNRIVENCAFRLEGTPCQGVLKGEILYYPRNVQRLFPSSRELVQLGAESYLGIPLMNPQKRVIGHLAFLDHGVIGEDRTTWAVLEAFAARAAAEVERLRTARKLETSERRFRLMADALPVCIAYVDAGQRYRYVNSTYESWHGMRPQDIEGCHVRDVLGDEAYRSVQHHIEAALRGRPQSFDYDARYAHGKHRFVHVEYVPDGTPGNWEGFYGLISDISDLKAHEVRLQSYRERLRSLAAEVVRAEERERRRIALALHDATLQNLAALRLALSDLRAPLEGTPAAASLETATRNAEQILRETRTLVFELSPPVLYELGLEAALEGLAERETAAGEMACSLQVPAPLPELTSDLEIFLYRAVRELLLNARVHGGARHARVRLECDDGVLHLAVEDDGCGFQATDDLLPSAAGGFGLFSIGERVQEYAGKLELESAPGSGTRVRLQVPVAPPPGEAAPEPAATTP